MTDEELISELRRVGNDDAAARIEKLVGLVKDAFFEGFSQGYDGGWIRNDPSLAWSESDTLADMGRK